MPSVVWRGARLSLASSAQLRGLSRGEISRAETVSERGLAVLGGLSCPLVFGALERCRCGALSGATALGQRCPRCEVVLVSFAMQQERLGHLSLAAPVLHPFFIDTACALLGWEEDELGRVLQWQALAVLEVFDASRAGGVGVGSLLRPKEAEARRGYPEDPILRAEGGAGAVRALLAGLDLGALSQSLRAEVAAQTSQAKRASLGARLAVVDDFLRTGAEPSWIVLDTVLILPPGRRALLPPRAKEEQPDGPPAWEEGDEIDPEAKHPSLTPVYERLLRANERRRLIEGGARERVAAADKSLQEALRVLFSLLGGERRALHEPAHEPPARSAVVVVAPDPGLGVGELGIPRGVAASLLGPALWGRLVALGVVRGPHEVGRARWEEPRARSLLSRALAASVAVLWREPPRDPRALRSFSPRLVEGGALRLHPSALLGLGAAPGEALRVWLPFGARAQREARAWLSLAEDAIPGLSAEAALGVAWLSSAGDEQAPRRVASPAAALSALERGELGPHDALSVTLPGEEAPRQTTAGRLLVAAQLPPALAGRALSGPLSRAALLSMVASLPREERLARCAALESLGLVWATRRGFSLGLLDLTTRAPREEVFAQLDAQEESVYEQYQEGLITDGERQSKLLDLKTCALDTLRSQHRDSLAGPLALLTEAGLVDAPMALSVALGMPTLPPQWFDTRVYRWITPCNEYVLRESWRDGLGCIPYFLHAAARRHESLRRTDQLARLDAILASLARLGASLRVTEPDCGSPWGARLPLSEAVGKIVAEGVRGDPSSTPPAWVGRRLSTDGGAALAAEGLDSLAVRVPLYCEAVAGLCAACAGVPWEGEPVPVGLRAVLALWSQAEAAPLREAEAPSSSRLVMASRAGSFRVLGLCVSSHGERTVIGRGARWQVCNALGTVIEEGALPAGARVALADGAPVSPGLVIAQWFAGWYLYAEGAGTVRLQDAWDGINLREQIDPFTGLARRVVGQFRREGSLPQLVLQDAAGRPLTLPQRQDSEARYSLPVGAQLMVSDGESVAVGALLAVRDEPQGRVSPPLSQLETLLVLDEPVSAAVLAPHDGAVRWRERGYGYGTSRLVTEIALTVQDGARVTALPLAPGTSLLVSQGEEVRAGQPLTEGARSYSRLLAVLGAEATLREWIEEVRAALQSLGLQTEREALWLLGSALFGWVRVRRAGDTWLHEGALYAAAVFARANREALAQGRQPAQGEAALAGLEESVARHESFAGLLLGHQKRSLEEAARGGATVDLTDPRHATRVGLSPGCARPGAAPQP